MMKFNWSFEQTFEYMLTKQPNFYLVPHFIAIGKGYSSSYQLSVFRIRIRYIYVYSESS